MGFERPVAEAVRVAPYEAAQVVPVQDRPVQAAPVTTANWLASDIDDQWQNWAHSGWIEYPRR